MKVSKAVILIGSLSVLTIAVLVRGQDGSQLYCGRRLAAALANLCYDGMLLKRSESPSYSTNDIMPYEKPYSWPWMTVYRAKSLQRGKRQAASECCEKPCTIDELMSYCA